MLSRLVVAALSVVALAVAPAGAHAQPHGSFMPGAPGIGDPYFPLDGNGGYDVSRYLLDFRYDPAVGVLHARETIRARHAEPVELQPRPPRPRDRRDLRGRAFRDLEPRRR